MIYFIQARGGGLIKIGTTIRLSARLSQLRADFGEDFRVLGVMAGGREQERRLHGRFSDLRQKGEWFDPGTELLGFIVSEARHWDGHDEVPQDRIDVTAEPEWVARVQAAASKLGLSAASMVRMFVTQRLDADGFPPERPMPRRNRKPE